MTLVAHLAEHDVHRRVLVLVGAGSGSVMGIVESRTETLGWILLAAVVTGFGGGLGAWIFSGIKDWIRQRRLYRRWLDTTSTSSPPPPMPPGAP
jgi:hypothetical protein